MNAYPFNSPDRAVKRHLYQLLGRQDVHEEEVITLGDNVEGMLEAWEQATKEEKHQILTTMPDALYVDLYSQKIVAVQVKPTFKPLFRACMDGSGNWEQSKLRMNREVVVLGDPDRDRTSDLQDAVR